MLPPGHIAGAYITTSFVLALVNPMLTPQQMMWLLGIGVFFGFAPDLDFFYVFLTRKTFTPSMKDANHRKFLSHAPILWFIAGVLIAAIAPDSFWKVFGLLVWTGSWTHFILDSVEGGVMWLWPWKNKQYALMGAHEEFRTSEKRFFSYWLSFTKWYAATFVSFWLELGVIAIAVYTFFR